MRISHIKLENWKNFQEVDVDLPDRVFLVGANATGKSNFLDAFRFLRDIVTEGFQKAVGDLRGGVPKIRCLAARQKPEILVEVRISENETGSSANDWIYKLAFTQTNVPPRIPIIHKEIVHRGSKLILNRPDTSDKTDKALLNQTALEQLSANKDFRTIADFFRTIYYRHLVPQIIKNPQEYQMTRLEKDPFGRDFLEQIASTPDRTRNSRLDKITAALQVAIPQLNDLKMEKDVRGVPHLVGKYKHWRKSEAKQSEAQFSDGTLRLIGLLWSLFEGDGPLLIEEPELSLHPGVVRRLVPMINRLQKQKKTGKSRQLIISTHSPELLSEEGISGHETLLLISDNEGTRIQQASAIAEVRELLEAGFTIAEAVLPHTEPKNLDQLEMIFK